MCGIAAFAVAAVAASGLVFSSPATAATVDEDDEQRVELHFSVGANGVIQEGAALPTTVTVANGTDDELSAGRIMLELNRTPLTDAAALDSWLDAGTVSGTFDDLTTDMTAPIAASERTSSTVFVSADMLGDLTPGVYPIRASLAGATTGEVQDDTLTARNVSANSVLVVDDAAGPQVAVFVPITATPADGALLSADELTELTAEDGSLTAQLDGVSGTAAVLAVDPSIPAAIRALGTTAPETATDWLARLEALPNDRFALQFGDADATVQAQAGLPALLGPTTLTPYLDPNDFIDEEIAATPSPSPSPTPPVPTVPDEAQLSEISGAVSGILWPRGDLDAADLATFDDYLDTAVTTILPSTSFAGNESAHGEVDGHRVLIADSAASAAFSRAAAEPTDLARANALAAGVAHLALAAPASSLLVGLERDETRTAEALRDSIAALTSAGQPIGLEALQSTEGTAVTLDAEPSPARSAGLLALLDDESELRAFSSILEDPQVLLSPERIQILRLIGVGSADRFDVALTEHRVQTDTTLDAVGVQQPSPVQLFTSAAPLPVWVRNDLPWPVNVRLAAEPSDARLDVQPITEVEAQPQSNTRVKVPVEARVGSGQLQVRFSLSSPTGVRIGHTESATVTVRAEWEGLGLGILGGLIALLLTFGVVRTVRQRRRDAAERASADAEIEQTGADSGEDLTEQEEQGDR